jgi:hypothetical protein
MYMSDRLGEEGGKLPGGKVAGTAGGGNRAVTGLDMRVLESSGAGPDGGACCLCQREGGGRHPIGWAWMEAGCLGSRRCGRSKDEMRLAGGRGQGQLCRLMAEAYEVQGAEDGLETRRAGVPVLVASNSLEWGGEVDGMDGTAVDGREVAVVVWSDAGQGSSCGRGGSSDAASDGESVPVAKRNNQAEVEAISKDGTWG